MPCRRQRFDTRVAAEDFLSRRAYPNKRTDQIPIRSYFCKTCRKWHVTSKPKGKRQQ